MLYRPCYCWWSIIRSSSPSLTSLFSLFHISLLFHLYSPHILFCWCYLVYHELQDILPLFLPPIPLSLYLIRSISVIDIFLCMRSHQPMQLSFLHHCFHHHIHNHAQISFSCFIFMFHFHVSHSCFIFLPTPNPRTARQKHREPNVMSAFESDCTLEKLNAWWYAVKWLRKAYDIILRGLHFKWSNKNSASIMVLYDWWYDDSMMII